MVSFVLASLICISAPGPDNLSVLSTGISRGRWAATAFGLGCGLGCLTHTFWATLGVSAVIAAHGWTLEVLRFSGAAYLVYLGLLALRSGTVRLSASRQSAASQP